VGVAVHTRPQRRIAQPTEWLKPGHGGREASGDTTDVHDDALTSSPYVV
jgi:hypothetical protein